MKKLMYLLMTFVIVTFTALPIFAGTVIIESWRNDDADAWNDKIIPAFNAQHPDIEVVFKQQFLRNTQPALVLNWRVAMQVT